tara:strand:- start:218 stop:376 length:159 start_codon:yes stop_codon:yes gene_type:complete
MQSKNIATLGLRRIKHRAVMGEVESNVFFELLSIGENQVNVEARKICSCRNK